MGKSESFVLKLDVDPDSWKKLCTIPALQILDLKQDLETVLRNRVEVLARIERHKLAQLACNK